MADKLPKDDNDIRYVGKFNDDGDVFMPVVIYDKDRKKALNQLNVRIRDGDDDEIFKEDHPAYVKDKDTHEKIEDTQDKIEDTKDAIKDMKEEIEKLQDNVKDMQNDDDYVKSVVKENESKQRKLIKKELKVTAEKDVDGEAFTVKKEDGLDEYTKFFVLASSDADNDDYKIKIDFGVEEKDAGYDYPLVNAVDFEDYGSHSKAMKEYKDILGDRIRVNIENKDEDDDHDFDIYLWVMK